jgi:hypothetical protein
MKHRRYINTVKKPSLIIAALTIMFKFSHAQEIKPNTIVRVDSTSFITSQNQPEIMVVFNSKNTYINKVPRHRNPDMTFDLQDKNSLLKAFRKVFNESRLEQLLPERFMQMTLYANTSGRVLAVTFFLNKNTVVTAQELEDLENTIKANVWFKLRPDEIKDQDFFDIVEAVRYSRVLDKTLQ